MSTSFSSGWNPTDPWYPHLGLTLSPDAIIWCILLQKLITATNQNSIAIDVVFQHLYLPQEARKQALPFFQNKYLMEKASEAREWFVEKGQNKLFAVLRWVQQDSELRQIVHVKGVQRHLLDWPEGPRDFAVGNVKNAFSIWYFYQIFIGFFTRDGDYSEVSINRSLPYRDLLVLLLRTCNRQFLWRAQGRLHPRPNESVREYLDRFLAEVRRQNPDEIMDDITEERLLQVLSQGGQYGDSLRTLYGRRSRFEWRNLLQMNWTDQIAANNLMKQRPLQLSHGLCEPRPGTVRVHYTFNDEQCTALTWFADTLNEQQQCCTPCILPLDLRDIGTALTLLEGDRSFIARKARPPSFIETAMTVPNRRYLRKSAHRVYFVEGSVCVKEHTLKLQHNEQTNGAALTLFRNIDCAVPLHMQVHDGIERFFVRPLNDSAVYVCPPQTRPMPADERGWRDWLGSLFSFASNDYLLGPDVAVHSVVERVEDLVAHMPHWIFLRIIDRVHQIPRMFKHVRPDRASLSMPLVQPNVDDQMPQWPRMGAADEDWGPRRTKPVARHCDEKKHSGNDDTDDDDNDDDDDDDDDDSDKE